MNTIPTTFKSPGYTYTIIGGRKSPGKGKFAHRVSILLLNKDSFFNPNNILFDLESKGFDDIISIVYSSENSQIESLSHKHPGVRFISFHKRAQTGEQINVGISEAKSPFVLVIWNDSTLPSSIPYDKLVQELRKRNHICVVPTIQNSKKEIVPSIQAPAFFKKTIRIIHLEPSKNNLNTLYPFDYCGFYNKEKFILSEGFDPNLQNPFWQKMDFGFRNYMWGDVISLTTLMKITLRSDVEADDSSPDESYRLFYLKNLSLLFSGDHGELPFNKITSYAFRSGVNLFTAVSEFRHVRKWVKINSYRFKQDSKSVTGLWEVHSE
jgi:hypothetical protein